MFNIKYLNKLFNSFINRLASDNKEIKRLKKLL